MSTEMYSEAYVNEAGLLSRAGAYRLHRACIELSTGCGIFKEESNPLDDIQLNEKLVTFAHEYLHYIQNFGTIAGIYEFTLWLSVLQSYSGSLDITGSIVTAPTQDNQSRATDALAALRVFQGDRGADDNGSATNLVKYQFEQVDVAFESHSFQRQILLLTFQSDDGSKTVSYNAGTIALFEGLAYEFDRMVAKASNHTQTDASFFPYQVLRTVGLAHDVKSPYELIALGTLALNTPEPWVYLMNSMARYEVQKPSAHKFHEFLMEEFDQLRGCLHERIDVILEHELLGFISMFEGRGAISAGMTYLCDDIRNMLTRRKSEPLFELLPIKSGQFKIDSFRNLIGMHPPCDVIQIGDGVWDLPGKDSLFTFHSTERRYLGLEYSEGMRALEAVMRAMMSHIGGGTIVQSSALDRREMTICPFFGACTLSRRTEHEDLCKDRPWEVVQHPSNRKCWYGAGVLGAMGTVDVKQVIYESDGTPTDIISQHDLSDANKTN